MGLKVRSKGIRRHDICFAKGQFRAGERARMLGEAQPMSAISLSDFSRSQH